MIRRVLIVGGGPGDREYLTVEATRALDRADCVLVAPDLRDLCSSNPRWDQKSRVVPDAEVLSLLRAALQKPGRYVWVVPESPALYPPASTVIRELADEGVDVELLSGLSDAVVMLDRGGYLWGSAERSSTRLVFDADRVDVQRGPGGNGGTEPGPRWQTEAMRLKEGRPELILIRPPEAPEPVRWREKRVLHGRRILLLRDGPKAQRASRWLEEQGAEILLAPVSELIDLPSYHELDRTLQHIERYDWVVLTSQEAVQRLFGRMAHHGLDIRRLRAKIAVVGPETGLRVRERGLVPDLIPRDEFNQSGLADAFQDVPVMGQNVLYPGGQKADPFLKETLMGRGALVDTVLLYLNRPCPLSVELHHRFKHHEIDAILYTASSSVEYLMDQLTSEERRYLQSVPAFSMGPLTSRTLQHYGVEAVAEPLEPSMRALVDLVSEYFHLMEE